MVKPVLSGAGKASKTQPHAGKHYRLVTSATSISRVTGFLRDTLNAKLFGAGLVSDSYFMAVRIPNLLRDLFAEGALSNAFVPTLTARLEKQGPEDAWRLMSQVFSLLFVVTGVLSALGILFAPQVVNVIAHGFISQPDKFQLTVQLTRFLFPVLLFVSMAALWMGALNALNKFTMPAFAPVFMNLTQIAVGVFLVIYWKGMAAEDELRNVRIWTLAMTFGMLLQWLVQLPEAIKAGMRVRWSWPPNHPGIKEMLRLMGPAVVSGSVLQVNLLVNQFFASFLATGFVSYLYYGNRLFQLPFGILGVSIATITFPLLARQSNSGMVKAFSYTLSQALSAGLFLMIPCTVGIWIVAEPACRLAFEYGRFTPEATHAAAQATALYALGLVGYTGVKILLPAYYARRNTRWPLISSFLAMAANGGLNWAAFLFLADSHSRFMGLALASALGATVNLVWLLSGLGKIDIRLHWDFILRETFKIVIAASVMGFTAYGTLKGLQSMDLPGSRVIDFLLPVSAGALVYFWLAKWMGLSGLGWVLGRAKR